MLLLHGGGKAPELALAERRQTAPDAHAATVWLGQSELNAALQGARQGAVAARADAEAEGTGHLLEIDLEAIGVGVEGVGQPA